LSFICVTDQGNTGEVCLFLIESVEAQPANTIDICTPSPIILSPRSPAYHPGMMTNGPRTSSGCVVPPSTPLTSPIHFHDNSKEVEVNSEGKEQTKGTRDSGCPLSPTKKNKRRKLSLRISLRQNMPPPGQLTQLINANVGISPE